MEKHSPKYVNESGMLEEITKIEYGDHALILYSDLTTLEYVYLNYTKSSLESLNEIILILPYYHSVPDVLDILTNKYVH
jgi:hypothetical protein